MKVNLPGTRRGWLFHLGTVFVFFAVIPCQAGVIVDIPAVSSEVTMQMESQQQQQQQQQEILMNQQRQHPLHTSQVPLASILRQAHRSNMVTSEVVVAIHKVSQGLSESCSRDVMRFVGEMMSLMKRQHVGSGETTPETWALQMLDAWAKPPEGILSGHVNALGDFDECIAIRAANKTNPRTLDFQGKYCLVYTVPTANGVTAAGMQGKVMQGERSVENLAKLLTIVGNAELPLIPSIGTCFPSTCSDNEIFAILQTLFPLMSLTPVVTFCSVDEPVHFSVGAIVTIALLVVLVILVAVGTTLELAINHNYLPRSIRQAKWFAGFHAFSLITNGRKFLNTETSVNDVSCLHGIRFLSASWVVLGHTYLMGIIQPLWNIVDTYTAITSSLSLVIIINAAIVVDVFFVIGGFLVALTLIVMLEKSKGKLNVPLLYVGRYLRITPMYMIIVCFGTFIFPLLGSGPYWHVAKTWAGFCEKNWWKNMLYINNLPIYDTKDPTDVPCHGMAWYLGVDMQLFLLSPFLLFPVWKWKRFGSIPLVLLTIVSIIIPGVLTYINNYAPTSVPFGDRSSRYSQEAYTPTYMRATPYLIGMCTGLLFHAIRKSTFKLPRSIVLGSWMIAFATGFAVLFSPQKFLDPEYNFERLESAIYVSSQRTAWSLAISWLIFACGTGNGGWINQILSWRPFVPLGRLTFAIYLVSMHLQFLFHLQYRQPIYFSNYHMVNLYFGHLVMSCAVAVVCTLVIEAPFMQLLKLVLPSGSKGARSAADNDDNNNSDNSDDPIMKRQHDARSSISPDPTGSGSISVTSDEVPSGYGTSSVTGSKDRLFNVE